MKTMRILIIFATLLIAGLAQAEDLTYRLLRNIEETATGELNCIFLDRQGLLWMGSNNGLKSYDGYRTRTFRSDAYSPDVLPSNTVLSMTEDRQGNMWIGTRNGLVMMDRRTGEYRTYHLPQDNQRIIYTLFTSADGTVWIGTDGGLTKYMPGSDSFYTYPNKGRDLNGRPVQMGGISVKSIVEDRQGHLYVGTWESGLLRLDAGGNNFVQYPKRNEMNSAYSLFIDSAGRLWIGTWGFGLECMERPAAKQDQGWRSYSKPGGFSVVYKMVEDPLTHTLWACCREGVSVVDLKDPAKGTTNYTQLTDQRTEHLSHSHDIATDGWGNIWIATTNEG